MAALEIVPVDADRLPALDELFATSRSTRRCWCTAYCSTAAEFALGWYGGGNRRRFQAQARSEAYPMGLVALDGGDPVGWCACGPRERYVATRSARTSLLSGLPSWTSEPVWFVACLYVRPDRSGVGVAPALLGAAIDAGRQAGACAVEAWPLARGVRRPGEAQVGREAVFARLGLRPRARPAAERVIMRLDYPMPG